MKEANVMKQTMLLLAAAFALGSTGVVHGLRSDRWGTATAVVEAASRLEAIPAQFEDWVGTSEEIDPRQLEVGQISGYLCRRYVHQASRQDVLIVIVCGRSGAIGAHTPEVCYQGAGFEMDAVATRQEIKKPEGSAEFWYSPATRPEPRLQHLALWWGWSPDGKRWEASANPRVQFAAAPALFKLYAIHEINDPKKAIGPDDPVIRLLEKLLPLVDRALSPE